MFNRVASALLIVAGILPFVACCCPGPSSGPPPGSGASGDSSGSDIFSSLTPEPLVDKDAYDRIKEGMAYAEVVAIIGSDGEELSSNRIGDLSTKMYAWKNRDGSNMNATFQNDRLVSKAQFGLKPETPVKAKRKAEAAKRAADERDAKERARKAERAEAERIAREKAARDAEREERERPAREAAERKAAAERAQREAAERERKAAEKLAQDEKDAETLLRLARNAPDDARKKKALLSLIDQYPKTKAAEEARKLLKSLDR